MTLKQAQQIFKQYQQALKNDKYGFNRIRGIYSAYKKPSNAKVKAFYKIKNSFIQPHIYSYSKFNFSVVSWIELDNQLYLFIHTQYSTYYAPVVGDLLTGIINELRIQ